VTALTHDIWSVCLLLVDLYALVAFLLQKRMTNRTNVGVMMAGQGATGDVFASTEQFLKVCLWFGSVQ
jgi:hypothetical protein